MYKTKEELKQLQSDYDNGSLAPTPKESMVINPSVAYLVSNEDIKNSLPNSTILKRIEPIYGKLSRFSTDYTPVHNLHWDYLFFTDSSIFAPAGNAFMKSVEATKGTRVKPSYTNFLPGTKAHKKFWEEEFLRITKGYEPLINGKPCGIRIPGEYYFYLNYGWMQKVEFNDEGEVIRDMSGMPDFLTMDYYYFREMEARENPRRFELPNSYKQSMSITKSRRKGFQQPLSSLLITEEGFIKMGDVKIGDKIYGPNGSTVNVTNIYPQGVDDVYEVSFLDGRKVLCGEDHLWEVHSRNRGKKGRSSKVVQTKDLINDLIVIGKKSNAYKHFIRPIEVVPFKKQELPLHPYVLGSMIGDGNITKQLKFCTADNESLDRVLKLLNDQFEDRYSATQSNGDVYNYRLVYNHESKEELAELKSKYGSSKYCNRVNPVHEILRGFKLNCTSENKYIPDQYKFSSYDQRLELLRGLMDTDGSISSHGDMSYSTNSIQLADDVAELIRSIGIHCTYKRKLSNNGVYRIYIHSNEPIFHLQRKLDRINRDKKITSYTAITSIKKLDTKEEQQCIEVDSNDHLYLTDGYIPTHNSYKAGAGAVWCTAFKNKAKVLIASAQGKDATLCFQKAMDIIDHISKYTPFGRKNPGRPQDNGGWKHITMSKTQDSGHFTFGLLNTRTGERAGRQSEIATASLFQKADAASGEGLTRLYIEEAGKISNLGDAWTFSLESMRVGSVYRSGIAIIFGTGGSMVAANGKKGSSQDFANIHDRPETVGVASYENIYEYKPSQRKCGYFVSDMWANFGSRITLDGKTYFGLDQQGNAIFWVAELAINKERIGKRPPIGKKKAYDKFLTQRCKTPGEAFLITTGSRFQTEDLVERRTQIATSRGGFESLRMPGELVEVDGRIEWIPKPMEEPLLNTTNEAEREGCFIRYEPPQKMYGQIPDDAYIISVDPIGMNTDTGKSLTAIIVFKTNKYEEWIGPEKIVGIYFGRKRIKPQDYVHRLLLKLSKYYNAKISVENDRDGGIPQYFIRKGEAARLMGPPITTLEKIMPGAKSSKRPYGHSMSSVRHKQIGEDLLYEWLDSRGTKKTYYDTETGEKTIEVGTRNIDRLEDELLINQLINYERNGNYDLVMAMMGIVVQLKEWYDPDEYGEWQEDNISDQLLNWKLKKYGSYEDKMKHIDKKFKI